MRAYVALTFRSLDTLWGTHVGEVAPLALANEMRVEVTVLNGVLSLCCFTLIYRPFIYTI